MTTERIDIIVQEKGSRVVKRNFQELGSTANATGKAVMRPAEELKRFDSAGRRSQGEIKKLRGGFSSLRSEASGLGGSLIDLRGILLSLGVAFGAREIIQTLDTFTNLNNRLKLVTQTTEELVAVREELQQISRDTRSDLETNAELFNRIALATRNLGISQQDVLDLTRSLNQAVQISGASSEEASAGLIQFSQGLASGALRGDELRSVLEQLPAVADVIAKELGVTRGELRELGKEGAITADVIVDAFRNAQDDLTNNFGQTVPTISQRLTVLRNEIITFVGEFDQVNRVTERVNTGIVFLTNNIDTLSKVLGAAGLASALTAASRALITFTAALAANPIGFLLTGLTLAISLIVTFRQELLQLARDTQINEFASVADLALAAWEIFFERLQVGLAVIRQEIGNFVDTARTIIQDFVTRLDLEPILNSISETFRKVFGDVEFTLLGFLRVYARSRDLIEQGTVATVNIVRLILDKGLSAAFDLAVQNINKFIGVIEDVLKNIPAAFQRTVVFIGDIFNDALDLIGSGIKALFRAIQQLSRGLFSEAEATAKQSRTTIENGFNNIEVRNLGNNLLPRVQNNFAGAADDLRDAIQAELDRVGREGFNEKFLEQAIAKATRNAVLRGGADGAGAAASRLIEGGGTDLSRLPAGGVEATRRGRDTSALDEILADLDKQAQLLELNNRERAIQNDLLRIEEQLRKKGLELTDEELQQVEVRLRNIQLLADQAKLLQEIRGPQEERNNQQAALNELLERGVITLEEFNLKQRQLTQEGLEDSTRFFDGIKRGLFGLQDEFSNFAAMGEELIVGTFKGAEDALVSFVQTGKLDFRDLANSIVQDLTRIAVRQALLGAVGGALGGFGAPVGAGGGGLGGIFGGFFANGGTAPGNRVISVGERGPELLVTPPQGAAVIPMQQQQQGQPVQQTQVVNVNVTTPDADSFRRSKRQIENSFARGV